MLRKKNESKKCSSTVALSFAVSVLHIGLNTLHQ